MPVNDSYVDIWRSLREAETNLVIRIAASLISGLVFAALGLAAAWTYTLVYAQRWVHEEYVIVSLFFACVCWYPALMWIWRGARRGRYFIRPAIATVALWAMTLLGGVAIDISPVQQEEFLIIALTLISGAATIFLWLPLLNRLFRGRPVIGPDNQVDVHCPDCGYSMIGLCDLRCPECGARFTIDELIRHQNYAGSRRPKDRPAHDEPLSAPDAAPDAAPAT